MFFVFIDVHFDPKESRFPKKDGIIVSNSLATFAYIKGKTIRFYFYTL